MLLKKSIPSMFFALQLAFSCQPCFSNVAAGPPEVSPIVDSKTKIDLSSFDILQGINLGPAIDPHS